jgi:O-antigen/teichoic acid export membrane protein
MSLRRNTLWNLAGAGLPFLVGVVTIPYLIRQVGVEAFGVLTLIWALIGYFSLFDFGLGRALTQQVASARAAGQEGQVPGLAKAGLTFTVLTGCVGGLLLAVLASPLAEKWLNVSAELQHDTLVSLLVAAFGIPLTTVTTGLRGILEAYDDFRGVNLLRMGLGVANFALPALSVILIGNSLVWMVVSLVLARLLLLLAHSALVHSRLAAGWIGAKIDKGDIRQLFSFGAWMTVSNIVSPLMVTADRFVISAILGAGVVAYYTVPFEALIRVLIIPGALTSALFPRLAAALATDMGLARKLYRDCGRVLLAVLLPVCMVILAGSKWSLALWLGADFAEHAWVAVCIMAIGLLFNGLAHLPFAAVQAAGNAKATAILHVAELVFYLPMLIILLNLYGIIGAAVAWSIRVLLDLAGLTFLARNLIAARMTSK